jgi:hypothetical protein
MPGVRCSKCEKIAARLRPCTVCGSNKHIDKKDPDAHHYRGIVEVYDARLEVFKGYAWGCSCGGHGRPDDISLMEHVSGYGWYDHFFKAVGVTQPREYEHWMFDSTKNKVGLRAAMLQAECFDPDKRTHPQKGKEPWDCK